MPDYCEPLKSSDRDAYGICEALRGRGYTLEQIDRGVTRPNFLAKKNSVFFLPDGNGRSTRGNGRAEPQEVYGTAIKLGEESFARRGETAFETGERPDDFLTFLEGKTDLRIPWLPANGTGDPMADRRLAALVAKPGNLIGDPLTADYERGSGISNYLLAEALYRFFRNDLGIRFSSYQNPRLGFREVPDFFREKVWNCIESYFFAGVLILFDIETVPVESTTDPHIMIALKLDRENPSRLTFVDFAREESGFDLPLHEDEWVEISRNDLLSYTHVNRAFPTPNSILVDAESRRLQRQELDRALRLSPRNYRVLASAGLYHYLGEEKPEGRRFYGESRLANPFFSPPEIPEHLR